ncbi:hypothetical protein [Burkholderia pseudomallei]|uniref:hypothetical protein n=1 Tax=Burkholderia pseudomallei TaxID=28450 RepID=UPI0028BF3BA9|nr:hypothetical protein [Burkholderia pseudomallei]
MQRRAAQPAPGRPAANCRLWARPVALGARDGASSGRVRAFVAMAAYDAATASNTSRARETARSPGDEHRAAMFSSRHVMFARPTMAR